MPKPKSDEKEMFKSGKVEIAERWLKSAWPKEKPKNFSDMTNAFKNYKKAKVGQSVGDLDTALNHIIRWSDVLQANVNKQFQNYPTAKKRALKDLDTLKDIAKKQIAENARRGAAPVVVYNKDFGFFVNAALKKKKLDRISLPKQMIEVRLLELLVTEIAAKNGEAMLNIKFNYVFDDAVSNCVTDLEKLVKAKSGLVDTKEIDKIRQKHVKALEADMVSVPTEVIRKIGIVKEISAKYKKDKAIKIGVAAGGVALSGAAIALPGTQPLAIVGLVRSVIALARQIADIAMKIETKIASFLSYLKTLSKWYKKHRGAREVTFSTLNSMIGTDILPTLAKAKSDLKEIENSLAVMFNYSQKLQKKVIEALDKSNKYTRGFTNFVNTTKKDAFGAWLDTNRTRKVTRSMASLDALLDKTHTIVSRCVKADKQVLTLRRNLKNLGDNPAEIDKACTIIGIAITAGMAIGGVADAGAAMSGVTVAAEHIASIAGASIAGLNDAVDIGKEVASL
jgi:hypothetical protein